MMNNYNEKKDTAKNSPLANLYNCRLSANLDEHNISNLLTSPINLGLVSPSEASLHALLGSKKKDFECEDLH